MVTTTRYADTVARTAEEARATVANILAERLVLDLTVRRRGPFWGRWWEVTAVHAAR